MTVAELIAELSKYPGNTIVWTAGCDCEAIANHVEPQPDGSILIERED